MCTSRKRVSCKHGISLLLHFSERERERERERKRERERVGWGVEEGYYKLCELVKICCYRVTDRSRSNNNINIRHNKTLFQTEK